MPRPGAIVARQGVRLRLGFESSRWPSGRASSGSLNGRTRAAASGIGENGPMAIDEVIAALAAQPFHTYTDLAARSPTAPPKAHGLYAWWQTAAALPDVPGTPHPTDPAFELLYVGTAPKDAVSKSHLRKR